MRSRHLGGLGSSSLWLLGALLLPLAAAPAAAQSARAIGDGIPGVPMVFDVQVPASWGAQEVTYEPRGVSRTTFTHRAWDGPVTVCPAGMTCFWAKLFLDHRLQPGDYTVRFEAHGASVHTVDGRVHVNAGPDADRDGMPDEWEYSVGLNAQSSQGDDGAAGDPDGDGVSNLDEFRAGTMPKGRFIQYFGESSPGDRQKMFPCFVSQQPDQKYYTPVRIRLIGDEGREQIADGCGMDTLSYVADRVLAVEVESFEPIVVERQVRSERDGYLSSAHPADPATDWHFAEGPSASPVDVFFLAYNPGSAPVVATFTYYRSDREAPVVTERTLGPGRTTVWINADEPSLAGGDFALAVHASAPILLDRGLRWHPPGRTVPQESSSPGTSRLSARWFFPHADGARQSDERIVLANPNDAGTQIEIATYTASRPPRVSYVNLGAHSRAVVRTADLGADASVALRLVSTNGVPIVAEQVQQGAGSPQGRWAFASPGAGASGSTWGLPSLFGQGSQVILFNPSTVDADVELQGLWFQGTYDTPTIRTYHFRVPAERLLAVPMVDRGFEDEPAGSISTLIDSAVIVSRSVSGADAAQIVVGRAAPGGALGTHNARTEHFVGTRLR